MRCSELRDLVLAWERGTDPFDLPDGHHAVSARETSLLREAREHAEHCEQCRSMAGVLLLMERDLLDIALIPDESPPEQRLGAAVMRRVRSVGSGSAASIAGRRLRVLAAAAVLLVVVTAGAALALTHGTWARAGDTLVVRFELTAPEANTVYLVGDFTEWDSSRIRLTDADHDGVWEATARLRKGKSYVYNFLIDGERWIADPRAEATVDDGFGGVSSVLIL